jgi:cell wall-associated NlpC family hydrolase
MPTPQQLAQTVISSALSFVGTPYQWGGTTKQGMDCSGLIITAFQTAGLKIPRVAGDQAKIGSVVEIDELMAGDLVFFTDKPGNTPITHVGLVVQPQYDKKSVIFVHASSGPKGVMQDQLLSKYWQSVFLYAVRPKYFEGGE